MNLALQFALVHVPHTNDSLKYEKYSCTTLC